VRAIAPLLVANIVSPENRRAVGNLIFPATGEQCRRRLPIEIRC
jgi:hypothetical protein